MSSNLSITKKCECCGKVFIEQKISTRYCSYKCNSRAYKQNKREFKMVGINYAAMQEMERLSDEYEKIKDKEYLSATETAFLLSVDRATIYRYLQKGKFKALQMDGKTFIRKSDIDKMFDDAGDYQHRARPNKEPIPVTEFYTVLEIKEKFNVKESWLYRVAREKNIPKTLIRGKSYFSKEHIDKYFGSKNDEQIQGIEEWYTVEDIQQKYNLSTAAIYSFVSEQDIPRKKEGRYIKISKPDLGTPLLK